ncbi:MAG: ATP synthase F1 subunit gamma [Lachnospiraceae bacterium]|nr:ATP synthase F1 subunit gamma [Lachnospiraceae bacterium]
MANAKEISNRIKSIKDTMKITKAMYMMSSMKMRKARLQLENTEPYFYGIQQNISEILLHFPSIEHLFFDNRAQDQREWVKRKAVIVVTADKGMAGAYNQSVIREATEFLKQCEDYKLYVIGEVGRRYFSARGYNIQEGFNYSVTNPSIHRARVITELMVEMYKRDQIDSVHIIYTKMVNSMKSEVDIHQVLPLKTKDFVKQELAERTGDGAFDDSDYVVDPSPEKVVENLAYNYVTGILYGVLVESYASEENSRMMAMQAATDNAEAMLHDLSIEFNRVRQAAITQEITEVIGGAKALKKKKEKAKAARKALAAKAEA